MKRLGVSATPGKEFEVHTGQTGKASTHAAALGELAVKLGIERAENLLPTQRSPAIVLRRNTGSLSIRSTLRLSSRPAVCYAGVSFASSDRAKLALRYRCTLASVTHLPRSLTW